MMQVFNATVRIGGELGQEVNKRGCTVPEILVLRRLHGNDSVINLKHVGYCEIDPIEERERLNEFYGNGLAHLHEDLKTSIEKMFGGDFNPLPEELRDFDGDLVDDEQADLYFYQQPDGYISPEFEDRATTIRKKAQAKRAGKTPAKQVEPVKKAVNVKKSASAGKAALDAIM